MQPNISEFSYGYAFTDELIHRYGTSLTAAPVFPSLYQEGQGGGGYDVMLERPGIPLFLQFKLADCLVRNNAQEVRTGIFTAPYYRMHLRPARHSQQHEMLLALEANGNDVYYSAPAFHTSEELNDAYLQRTVRIQSMWLRPSDIGPLPDEEPHYVSFRVPGTYYFCSSDPRPLQTKGDFGEFFKRVTDSYRERGRKAMSRQYLDEIAESITEIADKRRDISPRAKGVSRMELAARHPLDRIAFYSSVFLDCQLFIVQGDE